MASINNSSVKRSLISWSGGKDCCFAAIKALQQGVTPVVLLNMMNENGQISRSHGLPLSILHKQAASMNVPIVTIPSTWNDYEANYIATIKDLKDKYNLDCAVFGDIDLQVHRDWEENVCGSANLEATLPLWKRERRDLLVEMVDSGVEAIIVSCNMVMGERFLGRILTKELMVELELLDVDVCGENGEFHTLVVNCSLFSHQIELPSFTTQVHNNYCFINWNLENMADFKIEPLTDAIKDKLQHKIDFKTKPTGSLGLLEEVALQIGMIQNSTAPTLKNPHILVFAADHGIADENVSAFPQEVTYQMVYNFLQGGAAINVLCEQNGIAIKVIDAGVKHVFDAHPHLITLKVGNGTNNFAKGAAMSLEQLHSCLHYGASVVDSIHQAGSNIVGFGEMGIANTTSASALMHVFTGIALDDCVGKGTGINNESINHKVEVIRKAVAINTNAHTPLEKFAAFGGFEIAQIAGAMLRAAELKMVVMVDGFIATSAFLAASFINENIKDYAVFCHQSEEKGHKMMLSFLSAKPLLSLNMRLGEGTGCAVAYPIIQSAVTFLNKMASFESAGISNTEEVALNV